MYRKAKIVKNLNKWQKCLLGNSAMCIGAKRWEERENGTESSEMSCERIITFPHLLYLATKRTTGFQEGQMEPSLLLN